MEVSWVSLLILFCSCSNAINMKKGNSSIIDNFHLLDQLIQQEICKMLKEIKASSKFNSDDKTEASSDLCNHLETLGNEIDKNLEAVDKMKSPMSKIDLMAPIEFNSSARGVKMNDLRPAEMSNLAVSGNPLLPSLSTILEVPAPKEITSLASKNSTSSDLSKQNSLAPSMFDTRELIVNSNTPMKPDPIFDDEESNPPNSLDFPASGSNDREFINSHGELSVNHQQFPKANTRSTVFSIMFPGKCATSTSKHREYSSGSNSSSNFSTSTSSKESSTAINAEVRIDRIPEEFNEVAGERKNPSESTPSRANSQGKISTNISKYVLDQCPECSTTATTTSTANDLLYNLTCLKQCKIKPSTYNITSTSSHPSQLISNPILRSTLDRILPKAGSSKPLSSTAAWNKSEHAWSRSSTFLTQSVTTSIKTLLTGRNTSGSSEIAPFGTIVTPSSEKSTTDFCASSTIKHYQFVNTTVTPKSTPKSWCNPIKLTVNPKSPRSSRQNTRVYSSVGNLHSYAGFFNTDHSDNVRLFFWFFCNPKWKNTPLIVWLQGEPGLSSLHGLFEEHGPYYMKYTKKGVDIELREFSWTREYNVLYLDSCVGCGFSTADHEDAHPPNYDNVVRYVYEALMQFFNVWHEMRSNDLYLAGSYAGAKYIPVIAHKIHNENAMINYYSRRMNLKGLFIGGPYANSAAMVNYNDFLRANGIIDEVTYNEMIPLQYQAQELIKSGNYENAIDFINIHIHCLISQAGYDVYDDVRVLRQSQYENMKDIFQSDQFKRMICIDEKNFHSKSELLIEEIMPSVDNLMPNLLSHYKVLYYNGQFDLMAPYMLTAKSLLKLEWESIDRFYITETIQWCPYQNETACPQGFYRNYQNLTHVMLRNAGHFVGITQSKSLFYLLKWFVEDKFQRYQFNGNWYE